MSKRTASIITVIIIVVLGLVSYVEYTTRPADEPKPTASSTVEMPNPYKGQIKSVAAHYTYDSTTHIFTVSGIVETPTICDILNGSMSFDNTTDPVTAIIHLRLTNTSAVCAQAIGEQPFSVTFRGPEDTNITATLNGDPIQLELTKKEKK